MSNYHTGDLRTRHWSKNGGRYKLTSEDTLVGAVFESDERGAISRVYHPYTIHEGTKWESLKSEPLDGRAAKARIAKFAKMVVATVPTMSIMDGIRYWKTAACQHRAHEHRRYVVGPHVIAGRSSGLLIVNLTTGVLFGETRKSFEPRDLVEISAAQARKLVLAAKRANNLDDDLSETWFATKVEFAKYSKKLAEEIARAQASREAEEHARAEAAKAARDLEIAQFWRAINHEPVSARELEKEFPDLANERPAGMARRLHEMLVRELADA